LKLEAGVFIIGGIWIFLAIFLILVYALWLAWINAFYNDAQNGTAHEFPVYMTFLFVFSILIIYYIFVLGASIQLIIGTKKRHPAKLKPFMVFMLIGILLHFIQIFTNGFSGLFFAIFMAVIDIYWFICVYSLYVVLKNEKVMQEPQYPQTNIGMQDQYPYNPAYYPPAYSQPQQNYIVMQNQNQATETNASPAMTLDQGPPFYTQTPDSQTYPRGPMYLQQYFSQEPQEKVKL